MVLGQILNCTVSRNPAPLLTDTFNIIGAATDVRLNCKPGIFADSNIRWTQHVVTSAWHVRSQTLGVFKPTGPLEGLESGWMVP